MMTQLVHEMTFRVPDDDDTREAFIDACCSSFLKHGAVVINNAVSPIFLDDVNRAYQAKYGNLLDARREVGDKRTMIAVDIEPPFSLPSLFAPDTVMKVVKRLLGGHCILDAYVAVTSRPDSADQHVHVDFPLLFDEEEDASQALPPYAITLAIPLIPLSAMTGVTRVWPGTHRRRIDWENAQPDLTESLSIIPDFGGCYLFDARLLHGGTANHSEAERPILYIVYCRPWWRDSTNFNHQKPLLVRPEVLSTLPDELRSMFRYAS